MKRPPLPESLELLEKMLYLDFEFRLEREKGLYVLVRDMPDEAFDGRVYGTTAGRGHLGFSTEIEHAKKFTWKTVEKVMVSPRRGWDRWNTVKRLRVVQVDEDGRPLVLRPSYTRHAGWRR